MLLLSVAATPARPARLGASPVPAGFGLLRRLVDRVAAGAALAMLSFGARRARPAADDDAAAAADRRSRRFEAEILPHLDAAYDLARWLCRDADAAEDVVQEAFLRAFRAYDTHRGGSPRAWVLAIVRNCHRDWRDRRRRTEAGVVSLAPPRDDDGEEDAGFDPLAAIAAEGDPEGDLLARTRVDAVHGVLLALPERLREILVLRDLEDLAYREIAEVLGVPIGTVMSRLARARAAFAAQWTAATGEEEAS